VSDKKTFSERLYEMVKELLAEHGTKEVTQELGLQENYFSPSKYNLKRFKGKAVSHLDRMEECFGTDFLSGAHSALAREVESAESAGLLSQYDRKAIRSILRSARDHAGAGRKGRAAVAKVKKVSGRK